MSSLSSSTTTANSTATIPTAVVINKNDNNNNNNNNNNISTNGPTIEATAVYSVPMPIQGQELRQDIGICRGCGQSFQRPIGVHNAMAQYYRCKECCKLRLTDFCVIC